MKELRVKADINELQTVFEFVHSVIDQDSRTEDVVMSVEIAVDEIFTNIASYAYPEDNPGEAVIRVDMSTEDRLITIILEDWGKQFNPLNKEDPDINKPIEERQIGGLGIYMVKQSMDEVTYKYEDQKNIITMKKEY